MTISSPSTPSHPAGRGPARFTAAVLAVVAVVGTGCSRPSDATTLTIPPEVVEQAPAPPPSPPTVAPPIVVPPTVAAQTVGATAAPITQPPVAPPPPPPTGPPPLDMTFVPVTAVTEDGDAVIVTAIGNGVLAEGYFGPTDTLPEEGPVVQIAGVAVNREQSLAFVGTCCEPWPGYTIQVELPLVDLVEPAGRMGHSPAFDPSETRIAYVTLDAVGVADLALTQLDSIEVPGAFDVVWVSDSRFVVLTSSESASTVQAVDVMPDGTLQLGPSRFLVPHAVGEPVIAAVVTVGLAGVADGAVYVRGLAPAILSALDAVSLEPVPGLDVALPADPISAWWQDGQLRWIDADRILRIGERTMTGRYIWVR